MSVVSSTTQRVHELVSLYSGQKVLNAFILQHFSTPEWERIFWASFQHNIQLISQKSQVVEDHEINVTEIALKILHSQGKRISAANLYTEIMLGFNPLTNRDFAMDHMLIIDRARSIQNKELYKQQTKPKTRKLDEKQLELVNTQLRVYQAAKGAFQNLPNKSNDATQAARFLRDTAENCISYFQRLEADNKSDCKIDLKEHQGTIQELHKTFEQTKNLVEERCGGKKRDWDQYTSQQSQVDRPSKRKEGLELQKDRQRRHEKAEVKGRKQTGGSRQSPKTPSHQRKGKRNMTPDCYRPRY